MIDKLLLDDANEYSVLCNALEHFADELDEDDEDQPIVAALLERLYR